MSQILRLLDVVCRELGADDARAEVGGREPTDPKLVFCNLPGAWRLVAVFSEEPADRSALTERLSALAEAFSSTSPIAEEWLSVSHEICARRLDDELAVLSDRAGAVGAVVIDTQSPVIWGSSDRRRPDEDVERALEISAALTEAEAGGVDPISLVEQEPENARAALDRAGVEPRLAIVLLRELERIRAEPETGRASWRRHFRRYEAMAAVRGAAHESARLGSTSAEVVRRSSWAFLAKPFASIYSLVLVFEQGWSELHAQAAVVRALPAIERLVLALPPVEPPPRPGKVLRLTKPER